MGLLSGGIVTVLSNAVELKPVAEAGGLVSVFFALGYVVYIKYMKKQTDFEQTWEEKRKSIVNLFLSALDEDFIIINGIFEQLKLKGFDFDMESSKITLQNLRSVDYNVKEKLDKLLPHQNILGFITSEQYEAVSDYLKTSMTFVDLFNKQTYQKTQLKLREEQAKKILDLFSDEVNNHHALKEWKRCFSYS